jgi:hypothetical protein
MYIVSPINKGWLDAFAELSKLKFHTGTKSFTFLGVICVDGLCRCCDHPIPYVVMSPAVCASARKSASDCPKLALAQTKPTAHAKDCHRF